MTTCLSFFSNAQITTIDGYYISNTYGTVNCQLEYSKAGFSNKKSFINSSSSEIMFLNPNSNKGFFMSPNILYKTKIFNGEKRFFKVISEGDINLYTNGLDLFVSNISDSLMLLKGGKTVVNIKGKSYSHTIDAYNINMSYITLPVTIHHEINYNKLRPFVDLAFINRFYINSGSSIERTIIINDQVTNDIIEIEIPSHLMGLNLGIGVRQLFNIKNSVSYGISVDLVINKKDSNFKNSNTINFYTMYNL